MPETPTPPDAKEAPALPPEIEKAIEALEEESRDYGGQCALNEELSAEPFRKRQALDAALRTALSSLRAEVERLTRERDEARERTKQWQDFCLRHPEILPPEPAREIGELRARASAAETELAALRGRVGEMADDHEERASLSNLAPGVALLHEEIAETLRSLLPAATTAGEEDRHG